MQERVRCRHRLAFLLRGPALFQLPLEKRIEFFNMGHLVQAGFHGP